MKRFLLISFTILSFNLYSQDLEWFNQIKDVSDDIDINDLITDPAGNVYIGGSYDDQTTPQVDFMGNIPASNTHEQMGFIAKVNSSGVIQWMDKFGSPSSTTGYSPLSMIEKNGYLYVVGSYTYTAAPGLDFDPGVGTNYIQSANTDMFISKYDASTGAMIWAYAYSGTNGSDLATGVTIDDSENIYVTGYVNNGATPGDFNVKSPGSPAALGTSSKVHLFIAKYDKDCNFLWRNNITNSNAGSEADITVDLTNSYIYMAGGIAQGTGSLNPIFSGTTFTCTSTTVKECYIAKYDFSGTLQWVKNTGRNIAATSSSLNRSIKVDNTGNIYVGGSFGSQIDFDPSGGTSSLTPVGSIDGFVAKYTSAGALIWKYGIGSASFGEAINSIDVTSSGSIFIGGTLHGAAESNPEGTGGSKMVGSGATYTIFFGEYDTDFKWKWAYGITDAAATVTGNTAEAVTIDKNDPQTPVYVYGYISPAPLTENFNPSGGGVFSPSLEPKTATGAVGGNNANGFLAKYSATLTLPVKLLNFDAMLDGKYVKLAWSTGTEINNDYFSIERSIDAVNWENLSTIKGAGNSNNVSSYLDFDKLPLKGVSYYRLKQTDFNGEYSYSEIKMVKINEEKEISFYPNPANSVLNIYFSGGLKEELTISIINSLGQKVYNQSFDVDEKITNEKINIQQLSNGVYFVSFRTNSNVESKKLIIRR